MTAQIPAITAMRTINPAQPMQPVFEIDGLFPEFSVAATLEPLQPNDYADVNISGFRAVH